LAHGKGRRVGGQQRGKDARVVDQGFLRVCTRRTKRSTGGGSFNGLVLL